MVCTQVGDESFDSYRAERDGILSSLARRAKVSKTTLQISPPGVLCFYFILGLGLRKALARVQT